jgi:PKD repeat protein
VNWSATDASAGTAAATTAITIANLNRNPAITAPASVSAAENSPVSITGSASDPDGQNVTLSQTNNAAFLTGAASAGPALNPSITLSGTPPFGSSGSYTINWSANDGAGGTAAATTALTVGAVNRNPVITAPATASGTENTAVSITGSASDPDAGQLVTLSQSNNAAFLSGPASAGPTATPSITLTGTPSFSQAGSYTVNWSAVDNNSPTAGSATATTALTIANLNRNPAITAPATVSGTENAAVSVTGSAADPDAENVTLSQTNNAAFLAGPASAGPSLNPSITLSGTPSFSQSGSYTVNWSAVDGSTGTAAATTAITIANVNRNPAITAPASVSGTEGSAVSITGSASDPDGQNVTLSQTNNAAFLAGAASAGPSLNPSITLTGTPNSTQSGSYTVNWSANDGAGGTAAATTALTIANQNQAPTLDQPTAMTVNEGDTATQQLVGHDADSDPLTYSKVGTAPLYMTVSASGLVTLTPTFSDAGPATGTVRVSDGIASDTKSFAITVVNVNRCPTANAGGPYTGVINLPVSLNGSASSDPDGDVLSYNWDFGDGASIANGATLTHTYVAAGLYTVSLTVSDGTCPNTATTTANIVAEFPANSFAVGGNTKTSLGAGKPFTCIQIEPVNNSFNIADVNISTIRMIYNSNQIFADGSKSSVDGDKNGNGVTEISACFTKADMRVLFSGLPSGTSNVNVTIKGDMLTGGSFTTDMVMVVKSNGSFLAASVSPNPLNPAAKLSFNMSKPGALKVQLFDVNGRLLRTIADEQSATAGYHDYTIDGRTNSGDRMASGVYFVKIWTEFDGTETKSITILK